MHDIIFPAFSFLQQELGYTSTNVVANETSIGRERGETLPHTWWCPQRVLFVN